MPVLAAFYGHFAHEMPVHVIGQNESGNKALAAQFNPEFSILDDSALEVSFAAEIETVPTMLMLDASGAETARLVGFVKAEWQTLAADLSADQGLRELALDWSALPDWRPGCGSLSVDPANEPRLRALAEGSPIRARRIEIGSQDDEVEFMFDKGFSDGLPLVPPTPERVLAMLSGTKRDARKCWAKWRPTWAK